LRPAPINVNPCLSLLGAETRSRCRHRTAFSFNRTVCSAARGQQLFLEHQVSSTIVFKCEPLLRRFCWISPSDLFSFFFFMTFPPLKLTQLLQSDPDQLYQQALDLRQEKAGELALQTRIVCSPSRP